jgi:hypothetical protein
MPAKKKKAPRTGGLIDMLLPVAVLAVFMFVGYLLFLKPHTGPVRTALPSPPVEDDVRKAPAVDKHKDKPDAPRQAAPAPQKFKARVAIIIDDLGTDTAALQDILKLDAPVSIAVLPGVIKSEESALMAGKAGRDVLLHLPMQPKGENVTGLGPGALLAGMDRKTIAATIRKDLSSVPGAVGVNNHMGSYLTEDGEAMAAVMGVLKKDRLFFIDSMTSADSVAIDIASEHGVPTASRNVFLDDSSDQAEIKFQFDRMVRLALKNGTAIAIGHPRPDTIEVLRQELPGLREKGIEVVKVSKLVRQAD